MPKQLIPDEGTDRYAIGVVFGRAEETIVPTKLDIAYAAGIFDGEGNVTISVNKGVKEARGPIFNMRVGVSQNDIRPLLWLRDRWGGSVVAVKRKTTNHRTTHIWTCFARKAARFLNEVRPHLKVKSERADIALEFQSRIFNPGIGGHTDAHRAGLMELKLSLARLNGHNAMGMLINRPEA